MDSMQIRNPLLIWFVILGWQPLYIHEVCCSDATVVTTEMSSTSATSIVSVKLEYSCSKNTTTINTKARDWTPMDDDIEIYLSEFLDKYPTPRKEVDAFIHKILHDPTPRKRLPVFSEIYVGNM